MVCLVICPVFVVRKIWVYYHRLNGLKQPSSMSSQCYKSEGCARHDWVLCSGFHTVKRCPQGFVLLGSSRSFSKVMWLQSIQFLVVYTWGPHFFGGCSQLLKATHILRHTVPSIFKPASVESVSLFESFSPGRAQVLLRVHLIRSALAPW